MGMRHDLDWNARFNRAPSIWQAQKSGTGSKHSNSEVGVCACKQHFVRLFGWRFKIKINTQLPLGFAGTWRAGPILPAF